MTDVQFENTRTVAHGPGVVMLDVSEREIMTEYRFEIGDRVSVDGVVATVVTVTHFPEDKLPSYMLSSGNMWIPENAITLIKTRAEYRAQFANKE